MKLGQINNNLNVDGFYTGNGGTTGIKIVQSGNVGIGNTSPGAKLDVADVSVLGAELVTNGAFTTDTTGWTASYATLTSVTGGQSGNALEIKNTHGSFHGQARTTINTVPGKMYYVSIHQKSGITSGSILVGTSAGGSQIYSSPRLNNIASWTQHTFTFIATTTTTHIALSCNESGLDNTTLFDTLTIKEVTGGNIIARGFFTGGGTQGIKVDEDGNTIIGETTIKGDTIRKVSGLDTSLTIFDIYSQGKYVYMSSSNSTYEFHVVDVSDKENPSIVSQIAVGNGNNISIDIKDNYAFVGLASNSGYELYAVDISNPLSPSVVSGGLELSANVNDLFVSGNYAYLAMSGTPHFRVVDITNPSSMSLLGTMALPTMGTDVFVQGSYAYALSGSTGNDFHVIDVSNPNSVSEVGYIEMGTTANALFVKGNYAYVGTYSVSGNDFKVIDISTPTAPTEVAGVDVGTTISELYVEENYVYVLTTSGDRLRVIDISNPLVPVVVGTNADYSTQTPRDIVVQGAYIYIATSTTGDDFHILDQQGIYSPHGHIASFISEISTIDTLNVGYGGLINLGDGKFKGDLHLYSSSSYLNFGMSDGSSGYGIRDNAGTMQFKNSGGT